MPTEPSTATPQPCPRFATSMRRIAASLSLVVSAGVSALGNYLLEVQP